MPYTVIYHNLRTIAPSSNKNKAGEVASPSIDTVEYTVAIDFKALEDMARRAAASKGQKCSDGPLLVKIIKRTKVK